jgi:hypothetical protein
VDALELDHDYDRHDHDQALAGHDLAPLFARWGHAAARPGPALERLAHLLDRRVGRNPFWKGAPRPAEQLLAWLASEALHADLEAAFFAEPDPTRRELLSDVVACLEVYRSRHGRVV